MSTPRLPLQSWEQRIRNLAARQRLVGKPSEYSLPFQDADLDAAEYDALREADHESRSWLRRLWPILALVAGTGMTVSVLARLLRETEQAPATDEIAREMVRRAFEAAEKAALRPAVTGVGPLGPGGPVKPGDTVKIITPPFPPAPTPPVPGVPGGPGGPTVPPGGPRGPSGPEPPGPPQPSRRQQRLQAEWYARTAAALKMREWATGMRDDVRWQTVQALREGVGADELARRLSKRWGSHGQNFHMIAVTELGDAYAAGMLLSMPEHGFVTVLPIGDSRVCEECKELLESKVFEVLHRAPVNPSRFILETAVWPGKSNVGRDRDRWVPCITLHPRCRHAFVPFSDAPSRRRTGDDYHDR